MDGAQAVDAQASAAAAGHASDAADGHAADAGDGQATDDTAAQAPDAASSRLAEAPETAASSTDAPAADAQVVEAPAAPPAIAIEEDAASASGEGTERPRDSDPIDDLLAAIPRAPVFRLMAILDVMVDLPDPFAIVQMIEEEPPARRLDIPIGMADATSLGYALRARETPRPLTHALFADILRSYRIDIVAVRLTGRVRGTVQAEMDLMGPRGREIVACRPSDGLTLALRQKIAAPILADERLLEGPDDVEPR